MRAAPRNPFADNPSAALRATIARADMAPLRGRHARALAGHLRRQCRADGHDLTLSDIDASIAGSALRGQLGLTLRSPRRLQGDIDADSIDAAGLIAAAIGMPRPAGNSGGAMLVERAVCRRRYSAIMTAGSRSRRAAPACRRC